jgi:mannan endo-1,4-beta-mannosidase
MPPSNKPDQSSPFEIVTSGKSKKVGKIGIIVGVVIVIFLTLSIVAGVLLVRQQQNISEKASDTGTLPTATPTLTPTPTVTPTITPTPTPTTLGNSCNGVCGSNSNCESGLYCYSGFCRNPLCASDATCGCSSVTPTATASATPTGAQTTPRPIPVSGTNWPTVLGAGVGVTAIIVSLLLAI